MTEFTRVGLHCSAENCNQQDFLPFKCDCCNGVFCLSHRGYREHDCPSSGDKDFRALVCPFCKKTVRFADSQDPNEQWDIHRRTSCSPGDSSNNKTVKKRCSAASCREILRPTNTQRCARCGKETCLTHRFPDSHNCSGAGSWSNRAGGRTASGNAAAAREAASRPMSLREKAAQKRVAAASQDNTARGTADRRRQANASAVPAYGGGRGRGGGGSGHGEQCPQCGAGFGDVGSLVAHVEAYHSEERRPQGAGSGSDTSGESCPICNARFADVALLVSHVEVAHPNGPPSGMVAAFDGAMSQGGKNCSIS